MFEFKQYQIGEKPQNLVIFLHGYNGNLEDHQYAVDWLQKYLRAAILITPQAADACDKNPQKRQWFGMQKYDVENKRSLPTTTIADIFAIYNAAAEEIAVCARKINAFIDEQQQIYGIDDAHTFLLGFSQGAMLTIYAALSRHAKLGAAFAFSGLVAGEDLLAQNINSYPPLYMFHGVEDLKVQYKTLDTSIEWLRAHHLKVRQKIYPELMHRMNENEIRTAAQIINGA